MDVIKALETALQEGDLDTLHDLALSILESVQAQKIQRGEMPDNVVFLRRDAEIKIAR